MEERKWKQSVEVWRDKLLNSFCNKNISARKKMEFAWNKTFFNHAREFRRKEKQDMAVYTFTAIKSSRPKRKQIARWKSLGTGY